MLIFKWVPEAVFTQPRLSKVDDVQIRRFPQAIFSNLGEVFRLSSRKGVGDGDRLGPLHKEEGQDGG